MVIGGKIKPAFPSTSARLNRSMRVGCIPPLIISSFPLNLISSGCDGSSGDDDDDDDDDEDEGGVGTVFDAIDADSFLFVLLSLTEPLSFCC